MSTRTPRTPRTPRTRNDLPELRSINRTPSSRTINRTPTLVTPEETRRARKQRYIERINTLQERMGQPILSDYIIRGSSVDHLKNTIYPRVKAEYDEYSNSAGTVQNMVRGRLARNARGRMELDRKVRLHKEKSILQQQKVTNDHLDSLDNKQNKIDSLRSDLFANSVIRQKKNADGVLVEDEQWIEPINQTRVNTSIGCYINGSARRSKQGEWTNTQLKKYMIPLRI
jgi:hypothetical protein